MEIIGKRFESNNFGFFKVIDTVDKIKCKEPRYLIQFENTGSYNTASYNSIRHGRVKDRYAPIVAGVGFLGDYDGKITTDPFIYGLYRPWNDMLNRCYNVTDEDYPEYGAIGIRVDKAWFNFGTYLHDVQQLPGFNLKLKYWDIYQLDKDYLQLNIPKCNRIYSKHTCIWISKHDNILLMNTENGNKTGMMGIVERSGGYVVRYRNKSYGKYDNLIAAGNAYNNLFPLLTRSNPHANIFIPNNVPYIPQEEIIKHLMNPKELCKIVQ